VLFDTPIAFEDLPAQLRASLAMEAASCQRIDYF